MLTVGLAAYPAATVHGPLRTVLGLLGVGAIGLLLVGLVARSAKPLLLVTLAAAAAVLALLVTLAGGLTGAATGSEIRALGVGAAVMVTWIVAVLARRAGGH